MYIKEVACLFEWRKKKKTTQNVMQTKPQKVDDAAALPKQNADRHVAKRKLWRRLRLIFWVGLLGFFAYLVVQVVLVLSPQMRTTIVVEGEMVDALQVQGFVTIESIPVQSSGVMYYTVPTGQRVSEGDEVALIYADQAGVLAREELNSIQQEMEALQEVQESAVQAGDVDAILRETEENLLAYLDVLASGNYSDIAQPRNELAMSSNRLQLATGEETDYMLRMQTLQEQANALEGAAAAQGAVTAPQSGYFVPSGHQDRIPAVYEDLQAQTPQQLVEALQQAPTYYDDSVVGHMVTDYQWSFFTVIPWTEAEKFVVGDKMELRFTDVSDERLEVRVQAVEEDEQAGVAKVELLCEEVNPDILNLRLEEAEIIFGTETGLRLEKQALRVIEGQTCVYEVFGNQVRLRPVEVLVDGEDYVLLSDQYETNVNEIELYDEVVVESGGIELYDQKII